MCKLIEKFDVRDFWTYKEERKQILVYSESPRPAQARPKPVFQRRAQARARPSPKVQGPDPPGPDFSRPDPSLVVLLGKWNFLPQRLKSIGGSTAHAWSMLDYASIAQAIPVI